MAGIMYLGNQMVTPVIVQGGTDLSQYDFLSYIQFSGEDYVDFNDKEKTLSSQYTLIPFFGENKSYYGFGDKATMYNVTTDYLNDYIVFESFNGYRIYYWYLFFDENRKVGTVDEYTIEGSFFSSVANFEFVANRLIINNRKNNENTAVGENPLTLRVNSLNLDNYAYNEEHSDSAVIMDNTYLEVTNNTDNKVFEFYKLEGTLGFFVREGGLSTHTFTLKTTQDFSGLTFLDNYFYKTTIVSSESGGHYLKEITLTPKTKAELMVDGYTEDEADSLIGVFDEQFVDVTKSYDQRPTDIGTSENDVEIVVPFFFLSTIVGNLKPNLIECAQKNGVLQTKSILSGKFGSGIVGNITKIGNCYPVTKKDDNTSGFVDITDGTFYPFVTAQEELETENE